MPTLSLAKLRIARIPHPSRLPGPVGWTAAIAGFSVVYMALMMPLSSGTDEAQHAFRAYQLATGTLLPSLVQCVPHSHYVPCQVHFHGPYVPHQRTGGIVSYALYHFYLQLEAITQRPGSGSHFNPRFYTAGLATSFASARTIFAHFENTALYSPANYLPQTLIFWIGRQTAAPVVSTLIAARLLTGFVWAFMVTAAVALAPRWKWLFVMVVLVPTALTQGAMLATDSAVLAFAALAIAYGLWLAERGEPLGPAPVGLLCVLGFVIGLLKVPVPLLLVALIAILWPVLGTRLARFGRLVAIALPGLLAAIAWTVASNRYFVPYRNATFVPALDQNIHESGQEHYLIAHLVDVPSLLWQTAASGHLFGLNGLIGTIGQDGSAGPLPEWFAAVWLAILVVLAIGTREGAHPGRWLRSWMALAIALFGLATAFGIYITWTSVGAGEINGIHGRYYTPALLLAVPLLAGAGWKRIRIGPKALAATVMAVTLAGAIVVYARTAQYYYHQTPWQALPRVVSTIL